MSNSKTSNPYLQMPPNCGKETEIFSDEFDKKHTCKGCKQEIDFTQCKLDN